MSKKAKPIKIKKFSLTCDIAVWAGCMAIFITTIGTKPIIAAISFAVLLAHVFMENEKPTTKFMQTE